MNQNTICLLLLNLLWRILNKKKAMVNKTKWSKDLIFSWVLYLPTKHKFLNLHDGFLTIFVLSMIC